MSLDERYSSGKKGNRKQWIILAVVSILLAFFLILCPSFARYFNQWNGRMNAEIAQWNILINGVNLSVDSAEAVHVKLIPDSDKIVPGYPDKIKAGQTGYFDIEINPAGTEVSFSYSVAIDVSKLPNGMRIDEYSVNGAAKTALAENEKSVGGILVLPESGVFTADDSVTVRFFWDWKDDITDDGFDDLGEYRIGVTATVLQYCEGEIAGYTEGARA